MIRVLQFADVINRYDFIDNIVQQADRQRFLVGACVRSTESNIAAPEYSSHTPRWVLRGASRRHFLKTVWQLTYLLRRWNADILHTHHYDEAIIGWLATRLYPKTRLVIGRHYSDAIYRSSHGVKQRALLALEQRTNTAATRIIAPSSHIVEILTKWQGVRPDKVDRIPYGFVSQKYASVKTTHAQSIRAQLGLNESFVIGNFSRLHEEKGQRFLLEAVALLQKDLPRLKVLIVGEGQERKALEHQAQAMGLSDSVQLLGWRKDAMDIMAAVDVVVQPTLQEAFSQVMAEALWMSKPLVITDVSGAPDIIQDGQNGLLIPKKDPVALAATIKRLANDSQLCTQLGTKGRSYVIENLDVSRIIPQYEQAYLKAMGS